MNDEAEPRRKVGNEMWRERGKGLRSKVPILEVESVGESFGISV